MAGNTQPIMVERPQRTPEITREFQSLSDRMEGFEKALDYLSDRLSPALGESSPTTQASGSDIDPVCRMATQLRGFSNIIARWHSIIEDLSQRLEF